ncbi:MAG TPA: hypothetical protein DCY94_00770 [Firmicutes bacterium]|nr:hypothetical protein [Bacillota bacterium]
MDKNREVLTHCPHFYTIINFEYYNNDIISEKLIDIYEKFIFSVDISIPENVLKIEKLDDVLFKYIEDYCFREQIQKDILKIKVRRGENVLDTIVSAVISFFENYDKIRTRRVQVTRWI